MRAKTFFIGFFAVVALLAAASLYLSLTVDRADKTFTAVAAPDNKYKAVRITLSGGGASPFCIDGIAVILDVYPDEFAERDRAYLVYSGPCAADRNALPKTEWKSNTDLAIIYSKESAAQKSPVIKDLDVTKTVHVTFVAKD
ncbi:MAG TPA: hypothetical protein VGM57_06415 [Pseudolabrys sp.]